VFETPNPLSAAGADYTAHGGAITLANAPTSLRGWLTGTHGQITTNASTGVLTFLLAGVYMLTWLLELDTSVLGNAPGDVVMTLQNNPPDSIRTHLSIVDFPIVGGPSPERVSGSSRIVVPAAATAMTLSGETLVPSGTGVPLFAWQLEALGPYPNVGVQGYS
jgi:hypothetical protein